MMNEKTKSAIGRMADLLAEMTERAMEAERERNAAKEDVENWYRRYLKNNEQLRAAEAKLDAQIKENEELRKKIGEYIETIQKGAQENG